MKTTTVKANFDLLIAHLSNENTKFAMDHWYHRSHCGTVCCIGGWIQKLIEATDPNVHYSKVLRFLDLTPDQAIQLFYFELSDESTLTFDRKYAPPERKAIACAVLRHLRDHDEVDWDRAIAEFEANKVQAHT